MTKPSVWPEGNEARQWFSKLLNHRDEFNTEHKVWREALQAHFDAEKMRLWKSMYPRRKKIDMTKIVETDAFKEMRAPLQVRANTLMCDHDSLVKQWQWCLRELAEHCAIIPTPGQWTLHHEVDEGSYSSQGWGACRYAENSAKMTLLEVTAGSEIKGEIRDNYQKWEHPIRCASGETSHGHHTFEVWLQCGELDSQILHLAPTKLTMRDLIKYCLRSGVSPQVYYMGALPYGYEAKLGLTPCGDDLENRVPVINGVCTYCGKDYRGVEPQIVRECSDTKCPSNNEKKGWRACHA